LPRGGRYRGRHGVRSRLGRRPALGFQTLRAQRGGRDSRTHFITSTPTSATSTVGRDLKAISLELL
jgi:hypothetical protein